MLNVFDQGTKEVVQIEFEDGRTVSATLDHKFQTKLGMLPLKQILEEDLEILTT